VNVLRVWLLCQQRKHTMTTHRITASILRLCKVDQGVHDVFNDHPQSEGLRKRGRVIERLWDMVL